MDRLRYSIGMATLVAAAFGGWMLFAFLDKDDTAGKVPFVVEFADARGLQAGAYVRTRGVVVGTVQTVGLQPDGKRARTRILIEEDVAKQAKVGTVFWVVTPRFSGLTEGATGLDTLVRDAYVNFFTPADAGPPLAAGSTVLGREKPPDLSGEDTMIPPRHGDLLMDLLVPSNHGLAPGARVLFRGMPTGEVRRVRLATSGDHVVVGLRIDRDHRQTITDRTNFWIARPTVSMQLMSGISVSDLDALLSPYVGYYTEPDAGVPVTDGYRAAAAESRPTLEISAVPERAVRQADAAPAAGGSDLQLVQVVYFAIEEDTFFDDEIRRQSTGLLYVDKQGRVVVVTARSACDAAWFYRDGFGGDPEITHEEIKVVLPSGPVLAAGRAWTHADLDLAVLTLPDADPELAVTPAQRFELGEVADEILGVVVADAKGAAKAPIRAKRSALPEVGEHRGAVLLGTDGADGQAPAIVGILGQSAATTEQSVAIPLGGLPEALRPGS